MKPYYEEENIAIYCADCRDVLPHVGRFDLALTDPPYGINAARDRNSQKDGWVDYACPGWDQERPSAREFTYCRELAKHQIIWGGNYFADMLPARQCWLVWDKGQEDFSLADIELAWTSFDNASRRKLIHRASALADGKEHPTQKPVELMLWCIERIAKRYGGSVESILDPFLGSGTTLVACKKLGIRGVGIEKEEKYAEIAVRRILNTTPSLFTEVANE